MEPWLPFLLALLGAPALTFFGEFVSRTAQAKRIKTLAEAAITLKEPVATDAVAALIAAESDPRKPRRSRFWRLSIALVLIWAAILLVTLIDYAVFLPSGHGIKISDMLLENSVFLMTMLLLTLIFGAVWYRWTWIYKMIIKFKNK